MLVAQASPPAALEEAFVPTVNPVAGLIGIGTRAPPVNPPPRTPPAGAVAESANGRSAGVKAVRATTSAYPAALLLDTVTRSGRGAGLSPDVNVPKLSE